MDNFTYDVPTKIYFGKNQLGHLSELKLNGNKVLLVYGGGSIKRNGLYDCVSIILTQNNIRIFELPGVEPNPKIESVRKGVQLCKDNRIDMVLAVGGGSVIDCAKVIAAGARYDGDPWDLVLDSSKIIDCLPIFTVLTIAATGSEMDCWAVISDMSKHEKWDTGSPVMLPMMSILEPENTFSVPRRQTAAGTADMMSHTFENYFTNAEGAAVQAHLCEAVLKTCIEYGPAALEHPDDYDARANLMWCGSLALNGIESCGADVAWCVHPMEHELSAFYDITHGEGLAILTPVWMKYVLEKDPSKAVKFAAYGRNVWNIQETDNMKCSLTAIEKTADFFFRVMCMPDSLTKVGISDDSCFGIMADKAAKGCEGCFVPLTEKDIVEIYRRCL